MSVLKRITAGLTALSLVAVCTGCKNTTTAMTIDDYTVPAGVYLYYLSSAYNNAISQLAEENPDLDTEDIKAVKASVLEGKDIRTWCEDKAIEFCTDFVATEKKFDELGLTLSEENQTNIDSMMAYYWPSYEETMTADGISEESFKKVMISSYKSEEIFKYYYAVGGAEGVTDDDLREYYIENNMRAQYIAFDLHDSEGNLLKSEGKAEVKKLVDEYQKRAETAYKTGGAEAVMTEMDMIQADYAAYKESVAAEESAAAEEAAASEDGGTVEESLASFDAPKILTAEELSSDTEAETEDTTEPETESESSADEENTDAESDSDSSADEENTDAESESESSADEENTDAESDSDSSADKENTDETTDSDIDDLALEEDAELEEESVPYQNENIISIINKENYDSEEDIYYTPDEAVYNQLLSVTEADYGKIYFVEEDEMYYLVTRYDITQRMTEDDLWTESASENVLYAKYQKDFEAKLDEWSAALTVTRNAPAFRRYDPYEYHF
ncbi:MAG: hypothetical protein IJ642_13130 [Oscillospiraceae bacterium]|nr:hypothetical protein [Oscillospiraceae bacterium]